jgi:hypothetical protein
MTFVLQHGLTALQKISSAVSLGCKGFSVAAAQLPTEVTVLQSCLG